MVTSFISYAAPFRNKCTPELLKWSMKQEFSKCLATEVTIVFYLKLSLVGFPKLYWYGREGDFNLMVIELLGENLEDLMKTVGGKRFTTFTVLNIVD